MPSLNNILLFEHKLRTVFNKVLFRLIYLFANANKILGERDLNLGRQSWAVECKI